MAGVSIYKFFSSAFIRNVVGLSFHLLFSIILLGEEKIYGGKKTRFFS